MAKKAGSQQVGEIYYDVTLETGSLIADQRKVDRELKNTGASVDRFAGRLTAAAAAAAVLAAALIAMKIAERADEFRLLGARVEVASGSMERGSAAFDALVQISRRTQSSLAGNIEVFTRLNQSIIQMGGSQSDTLQMTELLAKAIKVSGANAMESKAAMLQFGQALGSGKLAGDELRSLLETAPYLMRQLADGIGVPVGALKKLGEEGKLTAEVVANSLSKAAGRIDEDFKKFPQTIESAMVVTADSAGLAMLKFDELSGGSAALTGVAKGTGEVFDELAKQFGAANTEAGKLGRNDAVKTWADASRLVLSYVADAASFLVRGFQQLTTGLAGLAASGAAILEGNVSGARAVLGGLLGDIKALNNTPLAGQQMRKAWEQGAGAGRGSIIPTGPASKLKSPGDGDGKKKSGKAPFDATGYIAGLEKATLDGVQRVDAIEQEALRKNDAHLKAKEISAAQHADAVKLIEANAAQERAEIRRKESEDAIARQVEYGAAEEANAKKLAEDRKRGRELAVATKSENDPIFRLQLELETKSALLAEAAQRDQENLQLYAEARVALEQDTAAKIVAVREKEAADKAAADSAQLMAYANLFDGMADLTKTFAGKQNGLYKVMFAASKAFAIADAAIKIQQGIANAAALPWPANLAAIASTVASTASIVSTIAGTSYGGGRQYGGPTSAGSLYRVNETGRPEMFTASNGNQFMLGSKSGSVTSADDLGGAAGVTVLVQVTNNHPSAAVTTRTDDSGRIVQIAVNEVANQLATNTGPVWQSLRAGSNVQSRL